MEGLDYRTMLKRIEGIEHEFGEITHLLNEATRDAVKVRAEATSSEMVDGMSHAYDLANAARQARAIEGLLAVMRYMISEAERGNNKEQGQH